MSVVAVVAIAVMNVACGAVPAEPPPVIASPASVWSNCDFVSGAGAQYLSPEPSSRVAQRADLQIVAIHEAASSLGREPARSGRAHVHVDRAVPTVLVVSAFEATRWDVTVEPGTRLEKVIVDGAGAHEIRVPAGVVVENLSGPGALAACGYGDEGECRTAELIGAAERVTGLTLGGFVGCRYGTDFGLYDSSDE